MKKMPLDRSRFTQRLSVPESRNSILCVNILSDVKFNMNGKLTEKLGGKTVEIFFTENGRNFLIIESGEMETPITFPKSGSKKIPGLEDMLTKQKLMLPARYEVWKRDDDCWQGDYLENPTSGPSAKRPSLKRQ